MLLKHDDTKIRNEVCDKTMFNELNEIVNPTLRERIDNAKVNFRLGAAIKAKTNPKMY